MSVMTLNRKNFKKRENFDKVLLKNYLTIRYNPEEKNSFPMATWKNFREKNSDPYGKTTEELLKKSIITYLSNIKGNIVVSLSSGIDSTLCLGLIRKVFPTRKIKTICAVFEDGTDESNKAKKISEKFDGDFKVVSFDSIFTSLPELVSIYGKPRWNTYHHIVAKEAKKYGSVLVTGDGADEIFAGYTFRYSKFLNLSRPNDNWKVKTINYLETHNRDWVPDQDQIFGNRINFDWNEIYNYFRPYFSNPINPLQQVLLADFNGKLVFDFIPTGKSIMKKYGLIGAPIFLNSNVINYGLNLKTNDKYDPKNQKGKLVLRKISKRLGIKHIDDKRGFSPDLLIDWEKNGKALMQNYLFNKNSCIFKKRLINFNWVIRAYEKVANDGDMRYLSRLISVLALEIWCRIYITQEISSKKKL